MNTDLYNIEGEIIGKTDLPDRIFQYPWNPDLVYQALNVQSQNSRKILAHSKGRGEVRGGGKKPWRQKGTGRARHGSIRSPIWKGGGVTHGPTKDRNYKIKINKKMKQAAIFSTLAKKFNDSEIKIVDQLKISEPKTKLVAEILKKIFVPREKQQKQASSLTKTELSLARVKKLSFGHGLSVGHKNQKISVLIIPAGVNELPLGQGLSVGQKNLIRAAKNILRTKSLDPRSLNVYDLLRYKHILLDKDAISIIDNHYHATS
ncbi:MAG: 50S ribosomal protein L4 [Candidatus Liptonbacteria bacterium]|nr:50S ribosomal protein L4 [Candidatus Liptonbacteria bacterium]